MLSPNSCLVDVLGVKRSFCIRISGFQYITEQTGVSPADLYKFVASGDPDMAMRLYPSVIVSAAIGGGLSEVEAHDLFEAMMKDVPYFTLRDIVIDIISAALVGRSPEDPDDAGKLTQKIRKTVNLILAQFMRFAQKSATLVRRK